MTRPSRCYLLVAATLVAGSSIVAWGLSLARSAAAELAGTTAVVPAEQVVLVVAGLGMTAAAGWLCLATVVCLVDLARGSRAPASGPLRPRALRHALLRAWAPTVGAAVVCAGGPVAADTGGPHGLPLPERPVASAAAPDRAVQRTARPGGGPVRLTVRPGDCLWTIAADLVQPSPPAGEVDRAWRVLYRANHARIGPDPDLVLPGTRLVLPRSVRQSLHPSR